MAKYTDFCNQIIENVGGKENISGAVHCMTRLRLNVKDRSKVNVEAVRDIKGAVGAQFSGDQFQIIIGQHVSDVYPEFCSIVGLGTVASIDENLDKEDFNIKKVPAKILEYVSGSIAPILPLFVGAGFFKMLYAVLGTGLLNVMSEQSQFMQMIYIVGNAGFYFLPVTVAWGAAKKLNTSIPLALLLGALLIDPNILGIVEAGVPFYVYGFIPMQLINYTQSLVPILLSVWALKYVFNFFNKYVPNAVKVIGVPFCTLVVMVPLMFCGLAPIGNWIGLSITVMIATLYKVAGPFAIAILGAFWPFFVATGMHIAIIQIAMINFTTLGFDPVVLAGGNIANYALMGMILAYFIRSKGEEKQMASANAVTLIVGGISEPTLFGVLLRNKKAMITQIIGGFAGGLVGGLFGVAVYTLTTANFLTILSFAGGESSNFIYGCIASGVAFSVSLIVGLTIGFDDKSEGKGLNFFKKKSA